MEPNIKRRIALVTIIACIFAFLPVFNAGFVNYDDPEYVLNNPFIRNFSFENIKRIFFLKTTDLYVPLTVFSYLLECSVFGANPKVFHAFNLVLHIINALLLLTVLTKLNVKNNLLVCFILLFFSLNPLVCESVCWITERKDVLYGLFYLLSAIRFLSYRQHGQTRHLLFCFLFFLLSCLSKPMAVSLPVLFLLYIFYSSRHGEPLNVRLKSTFFLIAFFLVSLVFSVISIHSLSATGIIPSATTTYNIMEKTALVFSEIGYYFAKPFIPFNQSLFHLFPVKEKLFSTHLVFYMLIGFAVSTMALYLFVVKKAKPLGYLFLAWLVFLLPVLQIYSNTHSYVSERYFYLSIIFPVIIVFLLLQRLNIKQSAYQFALVPMALMFIFLSYKRSGVWKNSQTLFEAELKANPDNPLALNNMGYHYNATANFARALPLLQKAVAIDGNNAQFLTNYGWALAATGQTDTAIVYLQKAIDINPTYTEALNNIGICYMQKRDPEKAAAYFKKAYAVSPDNNDVLFNLGLYYYNSGKQEQGLPLLQKAHELGNKKAGKYLNR
jgi:Tfp pilus assembly protein PilF